ncbi:MAG: TRAP transporter substrate-binding protein [Pseudomonadota bacterium]
MRKKQESFSLASVICMVLAIGLIWGLAGPTTAGAADFNLVIATWEPPKASMAQPLRDWLKELEERSGGRVTGKISYAAMGPPPKYYDLAVKGIAHVSLIGVPYTPGRFPMSDVVNLPITGDFSNEVFAKAYWALYKKGYFDEEFKDVKVLWLAGQAPYHLHMIKGKDIKTFADIKGKKLRASGAIHTEIIKSLGGIPVGMPAPEIPIAMQKGTIDGMFVGWSFVKAFRTEKITASVTNIGASSIFFALVMNKKMYQSMPDDIKKILDDMGPKYSAHTGRAFDQDTEDGLKLSKDAGCVIRDLPPADMEEVGKRLAPLWEKWIAEQELKGRPGKKIVADYYNILKSMGSKNPFHGYKP